MIKKRFDNIAECEGVTLIRNVSKTDTDAPAWEIPATTVKENEAIDNNMRLLHLNVARSAAMFN